MKNVNNKDERRNTPQDRSYFNDGRVIGNQSPDLLVSENLFAEERNVLKRLSKVIPDVEKGCGQGQETVQKEAKQRLHKP